MKIETTLDKVHLPHEDLQVVLKQYVKDQTGREVSGQIYFNLPSAWCELQAVDPGAESYKFPSNFKDDQNGGI